MPRLRTLHRLTGPLTPPITTLSTRFRRPLATLRCAITARPLRVGAARARTLVGRAFFSPTPRLLTSFTTRRLPPLLLAATLPRFLRSALTLPLTLSLPLTLTLSTLRRLSALRSLGLP